MKVLQAERDGLRAPGGVQTRPSGRAELGSPGFDSRAEGGSLPRQAIRSQRPGRQPGQSTWQRWWKGPGEQLAAAAAAAAAAMVAAPLNVSPCETTGSQQLLLLLLFVSDSGSFSSRARPRVTQLVPQLLR